MDRREYLAHKIRTNFATGLVADIQGLRARHCSIAEIARATCVTSGVVREILDSPEAWAKRHGVVLGRRTHSEYLPTPTQIAAAMAEGRLQQLADAAAANNAKPSSIDMPLHSLFPTDGRVGREGMSPDGI